MTATAQASTQADKTTIRGRLAARKPITPPQQQDDTLLVVRRLFGYMASGESRREFIKGLTIRLIGVLALVAMPFFTGMAINVVTAPSGDFNQLLLPNTQVLNFGKRVRVESNFIENLNSLGDGFVGVNDDSIDNFIA